VRWVREKVQAVVPGQLLVLSKRADRGNRKTDVVDHSRYFGIPGFGEGSGEEAR